MYCFLVLFYIVENYKLYIFSDDYLCYFLQHIFDHKKRRKIPNEIKTNRLGKNLTVEKNQTSQVDLHLPRINFLVRGALQTS